jgi:glycosyltransferase involved in cell wall biosynthesis
LDTVSHLLDLVNISFLCYRKKEVYVSLRIVIPTIGLDNRGGTRVYLELANILSRRGHQVTILVPRGSNTTTFIIDPKVTLKLIGFAIPQKEDISSIIRLIMLFPLLGECDVIIANYYLTAFPVAFSSMFMPKRICVNLIQHYEPLAFGEAESTYPMLKKWLGELSYKFPMHQVVVSEWIKKRVLQISKNDITVINPNIDLETFKPPNIPAEREKNSILVFPGKDIWKGWDDFVQAFAILDNGDFELKVIASSRFPFPLPPGPYISVHPEDDKALVKSYQAATIYVHPSWWEGCPLAPLEAMACGTPVVAAASEGILEYAVDGENCLLVPPKSPTALAEALHRILNEDSLRTRLVDCGYETVKRFAWPKMANQFEDFLISMCSK